MIRNDEVEVERECGRVYVNLPGHRYPSGQEPLRQAGARVRRLEWTAGELVDEAD